MHRQGITRSDNARDLVTDSGFYVGQGIPVSPRQIHVAKRIGIDYAEEATDYLWRFYIDESSLI